jgi:hypothetical protein
MCVQEEIFLQFLYIIKKKERTLLFSAGEHEALAKKRDWQ